MSEWKEKLTCLCGRKPESILVINETLRLPYCGDFECERMMVAHVQLTERMTMQKAAQRMQDAVERFDKATQGHEPGGTIRNPAYSPGTDARFKSKMRNR